MPTQAQLAAAFKAARAFIDQEAGFYARMIPDSDVQKLCQIVLDAAALPVSSTATKESET
jgi:hypothetical protein